MEYTLTSRQAADRLGVTVKTMQRWEREGRLIPAGRTQTNRRVYTTEQIARFQGLRWSGGQEATRIIAYCRVSRAAQKADLKNQRRVLEDFCMGRGLANVEFVEEVGLKERILKGIAEINEAPVPFHWKKFDLELT
jgi:predicted site-specific integrase-resolvase